MTEPAKPIELEIRVDGRIAHRFLAERFTTHEDGQLLTLEASRWTPTIDPARVDELLRGANALLEHHTEGTAE